MAHPNTAGGADSRKHITTATLSVAPHLVGLPLASPTRRLGAILIDLCLVAILANLGGKVLFALAIGVAFFWFAGRKLGKGGTFFSRTGKMALRGVGALFLFIAAASLANKAQDSIGGDDADEGNGKAPAQAALAGASASPMTGLRMVGEMVAVENAEDSAHAAAAARAAVRHMRRMGMTDAQIRESVLEMSKDRDEDAAKPWVPAAWLAAAPADTTKAVELPGDSLAALYVAAVHEDDSAAAGALRPKLASVLARDSLDELHGHVADLEREKTALARKVEEEENKGLLATLLGFFDDLGFGFGWTSLYFTAFTALWRGQTPGKKLFGIRVLRLDGLPMTLWASFERFGGYAAGLFTGLVGYAQVYWDRNRQAIQDKISETVVIRDLGPLPVAPQPQPAWAPHAGAGPGAPWPPPSPNPPYPPAGPGQPFPRG